MEGIADRKNSMTLVLRRERAEAVKDLIDTTLALHVLDYNAEAHAHLREVSTIIGSWLRAKKPTL